MSIHRKKSAVINSQVRIRNELSQVFVPNNNLGISINTTTVPVNSTGTISTQQYANISDISYAYSIGENWVNAVSGVVDNNWFTVCWSSELRLFCALSNLNNQHLMLSSNGLNWNVATDDILGTWRAVCWAPKIGKFCAVAESGTSNVMLSSNGLTWSGITTGIANQWRGVCWSPELNIFCAVSITGTNRSMISSDGTTWINTTSGLPSNTWYAVCWSPELKIFCAVSTTIAISSDGLTWISAVSVPTSTDLRSVCWSSKLGLFCAVSILGTLAMVSSDGLYWTASINGVIANQWRGVCWAPELQLFCAVANSGTNNNERLMISRDGLYWQNVRNIRLSYNCNSICWAPELTRFCVVSSNGTANQRVIITDTSNVPMTTTNNYYIPLVSSNELKTNTTISYNIKNDTLLLNNLSTTNPPSCSVAPVNSNDLINKAYLNSFVGDYTQGWIYDDWITGDASGSLNWNIDKPANASIIASDASGHIGILRLNASSNGNVSGITLYFISGNVFNYSNIKSVKFIVKPFSDVYDVNGFVFIGLSDGYNAIANYSVGFYRNQGSGWFYVMNQAIINTNVYYTLPVNIQQKWILFEIEITNNIPIFYITIENGSRQVACAPGTTITTTTLVSPVIRQTSNSIDIDYIDLKYTGLTRR